MSVVFCHSCGASLARSARFCGECGTPTKSHARQRHEAFVAERRRDARHTAAVAVVFVGALGGMSLLVPVVEHLELEWDGAAALALLAQVSAGLVACLVLGGSALRASFAGLPGALDTALGVVAGIAAYAVAVGYVALLPFDVEGIDELGWTAVLAAVVGAPLVEEWLDRGVLWRALEPLTSVAGTIVVSAVLFALMHGLNGGWVLEMPHRLVAGLLFGWLRSRSGSLVPGIVAHAVLNGIATIVDE